MVEHFRNELLRFTVDETDLYQKPQILQIKKARNRSTAYDRRSDRNRIHSHRCSAIRKQCKSLAATRRPDNSRGRRRHRLAAAASWTDAIHKHSEMSRFLFSVRSKDPFGDFPPWRFLSPDSPPYREPLVSGYRDPCLAFDRATT